MRNIDEFQFVDIESDCFDMLIASLTLWLKGEYRFLFTDCLGFQVNPNGASPAERIVIDKGDIIDNANKNGMGIHFRYMKDVDVNELVILLDQYNPLMAELDEYNCFWRKNYHKIHRNHYVLLIDYSAKESSFACIDTYPTNRNFALPNEFILQNMKRFLYADPDKKKLIKYPVEDYLFPTIKKFSQTSEMGTIWDRYDWFIDDIGLNFDIKKEIEDFSNIDIIYIPFIWKLKNISWSFVQFRYLLDYLDDDKLTNIEKKISEIRKHWEVMINSIAMSIIRHDSSVSIENIQDYIRKAVYSEKLLIQELSLYR